MPKYDSGHHPHGGRLNAVSAPAPRTAHNRHLCVGEELLMNPVRSVFEMQRAARLQYKREYQCRDS